MTWKKFWTIQCKPSKVTVYQNFVWQTDRQTQPEILQLRQTIESSLRSGRWFLKYGKLLLPASVFKYQVIRCGNYVIFNACCLSVIFVGAILNKKNIHRFEVFQIGWADFLKVRLVSKSCHAHDRLHLGLDSSLFRTYVLPIQICLMHEQGIPRGAKFTEKQVENSNLSGSTFRFCCTKLLVQTAIIQVCQKTFCTAKRIHWKTQENDMWWENVLQMIQNY